LPHFGLHSLSLSRQVKEVNLISFIFTKSIIIFGKRGANIMNKILNRILTFAILLLIATSLLGCPPPPWWGGGRHHHHRYGGFTTSIK
jgi:hypothetical protein